MYPELEQSSGCRISRQVSQTAAAEVYEGVDSDTGRPVRMVAFSAQASASPRFREALKSDLTRLGHLHHAAIAGGLSCREWNGRLVLLQQAPHWPCLACSARTPDLTSDDIVEIGWQLCSALQHAHNLGICHQGIAEDCILLSNDLRVVLVDFRIATWLARLDPAPAPSSDRRGVETLSSTASSDAAREDLKSLLRILRHCAERISTHDSSPSASAAEQQRGARLLRLIDGLLGIADSRWTSIARDIQGMLGEVLLADSRDAIPIEDARTDGTGTRRSIVRELFEKAEPKTPRTPVAHHAIPRRFPLILPIVIAAAVIAILLWAAGIL